MRSRWRLSAGRMRRDSARGAKVSRSRWRVLGLLAVVVGGLTPAISQYDFSDEPLLASTISDKDVELRGRWVRQWRDDAGALVLMFNGGFRLDLGERRMSANNAVVWIEPHQNTENNRKYYTLTVYLVENAEVVEPAGTATMDAVLLVRGLRTYGRIIKYQDAYAAENMEHSPLFQRALRDRLAVEASEAEQVPGQEVAHPTPVEATVARPQRVIRYRLGNIEPAKTPSDEAVFVSTGGVYFAQDGGPDAPLLEIRADNAVIFPAAGGRALISETGAEAPATQPAAPTVEGPPVTEKSTLESGEPTPRPLIGPLPDETETVDEGAVLPAPAVEEPDAPGALGLGGVGDERIRAVYLEGDVVLSQGDRFIRAGRLYYDFQRERALILDAVFRADVPGRGIPLYVRADEIRQLSGREYAAYNAVVTTSEFYTPSYHVGAERVYLRDLTPRDTGGQPTSPLVGEYEFRNSTLNVGGVPVGWWPYSRGRLESSETLLRSIRTGYSGDFGYEFESRWFLFNLLGITPPAGVDATLMLDYLSRRGPGVGIETVYEQPDYYGLLRTYFIYDEGRDNLGPLREYEEVPPTETRGRALWRHRHYLPYDWEITLEASYYTDANFLETYFPDEFFEDKQQETLIYLKRAKGVEALTFLANWRILDFLTQTEHLPDLTYRRIGDLLGPLVLYHESRVGAVRRSLDERHAIDDFRDSNFGSTDVTFRSDVRQEAELPLKVGPLNMVPFASVRGSYWDGQPLATGGLWRGFGLYGVRGGTSFSKVYDDVQSKLLDIDRIRHVIKPDFVVWWSNSNVRSSQISPFDYGIETINDIYGASAGLRQVWQTKRGIGELRRTVDLLTLNLEFGVFGNGEDLWMPSNGYANPYRPENSRVRNYFAGEFIYRLSDSTSLLYDFNFDLNDRTFDRSNFAITVERSPRLAYVFGTRYAYDVGENLVGGGWNYKLNEKHTTAVRAWWDIEEGALGEISLGYIRKLPRWYTGLNLEYDNVDDECSVTLSLWPEGVPEWGLGSRRYTGVAENAMIRP